HLLLLALRFCRSVFRRGWFCGLQLRIFEHRRSTLDYRDAFVIVRHLPIPREGLFAELRGEVPVLEHDSRGWLATTRLIGDLKFLRERIARGRNPDREFDVGVLIG